MVLGLVLKTRLIYVLGLKLWIHSNFLVPPAKEFKNSIERAIAWKL